MSGYNWRDVLADYSAVSGVLAGFTLTFVVFILAWSLADHPLFSFISWGHVGILLNGISSALFITASEFFLVSKEHNVWALPDKYEKFLSKGFKDWKNRREENITRCLQYEERGRHCYNAGIVLIFGAVFFVIGPYNLTIAFIVSGLGIGLELYQVRTAQKAQKK